MSIARAPGPAGRRASPFVSRAAGIQGRHVMQVIAANGLNIHARLDGPPDRPVVVFVNSLGTDLRVWSDTLAALDGSWRTLRYDFRGHGLTDCPLPPYPMEDHVDDLAALLDARDLRNVVLCGVSVGGMIAQGLALRQPDRVRALILSNTGHRIGSRDGWQERLSAIESGGIEILADAVIARWFSPAFRRDRPAEVAAWRNMLVRTPVDGYLGTCASLRDADHTDTVGGISQPTLCVAGSEDGATPPELVRDLAARLPDARYREIDGAGHLPGVERPAEMAALIRDFLRENDLA